MDGDSLESHWRLASPVSNESGENISGLNSIINQRVAIFQTK
jgi:hypothetical protein